jgi:hypothetical protein
MMNMTAMLTRGVRNLTAVTVTRRASFYRLFSSTSSPTPSPPPSGVVVSGAAADVADVVEEEEEEDEAQNLVYSDAATSLAVKPAIPTILQPRVVVYDGVCHLCHRGTCTLCFKSFFFPPPRVSLFQMHFEI